VLRLIKENGTTLVSGISEEGRMHAEIASRRRRFFAWLIDGALLQILVVVLLFYVFARAEQYAIFPGNLQWLWLIPLSQVGQYVV
jgi:hypothetical protein